MRNSLGSVCLPEGALVIRLGKTQCSIANFTIQFSRWKREVMMKSIAWKALTLAAFAVGVTSLSVAQSAAPNPIVTDFTSRVEPPHTADKAPVPPASTKTNEPAATPAATKQELKPTVEQEIEALKNRIDQLENEVKV